MRKNTKKHISGRIFTFILALMMLAMTSCGEIDELIGETADDPAAGDGAVAEEEDADPGDNEETEPEEALVTGQQGDTDLSDRPNADDGTGKPKILEEGDIAPDFTAKLYDGGSFKLSDHDDKIVIVNFWATWCGPCVNEMPAFEMLKNDEMENLEIVCINCMEDKDTVDRFVKENGYTFNIGYDEEGRILSYYPTDGIPYTLVVKKGRISSIFVGAMDAETQYREYKNAVSE